MTKFSEKEKQNFLEEMKKFIAEEDKWLRDMMNNLGWNIEDLSGETEVNPIKYEICPMNEGHRVPECCLEAHISKCSKNHGKWPEISHDDLCFNQDFTGNSSDKTKVTDIDLQRTYDDSTSISQSSSQCLIELLSAERDAKRRRAAYRKKRVHTNKKSYNEILHELIDNEMKTLVSGLKTEEDGEGSSLANVVGEPASKNSTYAGVGNWIYHGNPYKRWTTIKEEEKELLEAIDRAERTRDDSCSKHSSEKVRYSRDNRFNKSYKVEYGSGRHERVHRDEHRHSEKRRRLGYSRRHSRSDDESTHRERSSQRSFSRACSNYKFSNNSDRMSVKSDERRMKTNTSTADASGEHISETVENSVKSSERSKLPNIHDKTSVDEAEIHELDEISKTKNDELCKHRRRSSSASDLERKHHKKKRKHKKDSKKKKKRRKSYDSS